MKGHCSAYCKSKSFEMEILYNNSISTYWKTDANKYISTLMPAQRSKRYTSKHKALGLAKCKVCEYITAKPTQPGTICKCCQQTFSQSIRDVRYTATNKHARRNYS